MNVSRRIPVCQLLRTTHRRQFSCSGRRTIQPLQSIENGDLTHFQEKFWLPEIPALLPSCHLEPAPAATRWFSIDPARSKPTVNTEYLKSHGDPMVPLELTKLLQQGQGPHQQKGFQRFDAPFSLFLHWLERVDEGSSDRLYLAQASLSRFPACIQRDLPLPFLVASAGKGHVYDTNLWIGLAPTYTPLHRDPNPNLFVQLVGEKVVRLFPPYHGSLIYDRVRRELKQDSSAMFRGEEMMQGEELRLLDKMVWGIEDEDDGAKQEGYEVRLGRGDGLFIPKGWWHSIKGVGNGLTGSANWWFR